MNIFLHLLFFGILFAYKILGMNLAYIAKSMPTICIAIFIPGTVIARRAIFIPGIILAYHAKTIPGTLLT